MQVEASSRGIKNTAAFYIAGLQPWRNLSFGVGALAILGVAFHVLRAVI